MEMVVDFEIFPPDEKEREKGEKEREKKVRVVFDKWSNGKGLMPTGETTNALLQLTDGGLWLKVMQGLLVKVNICSVYASGESQKDLQYKTFAEMWKKYSGHLGFIDKARVKDFVRELVVEKET